MWQTLTKFVTLYTLITFDVTLDHLYTLVILVTLDALVTLYKMWQTVTKSDRKWQNMTTSNKMWQKVITCDKLWQNLTKWPMWLNGMSFLPIIWYTMLLFINEVILVCHLMTNFGVPFWYFVTFYHNLPFVETVCEILSKCVTCYPILSHFVSFCHILSLSVTLCHSLSHFVQSGQSIQSDRNYQSVQMVQRDQFD